MSKSKVLVVDDDVITRKMVQLSLGRHGYQTCEAADGHDALNRLSREHFHIVISDWNMPRMDGLELCRQIRRRDGYIYTILLTSRNDAEDRIAGLQAGADDFIGKPFNSEELFQRVAAGERLLRLETREALIFALAKLAESRDTDTGHHLERVQRYSRFLAEQLKGSAGCGEVNDEFIQLLFQTSPLHDIGKVGIPDAILLKAGKLSVAQFEVMKTHTSIGAACLEGAIAKSPGARFLHMARDIALYHHEKFDGSGYPSGMRGEEIPLCARIVAVADVYDALRSFRIYKPAFSHEESCRIIMRDAGSHFDPRIVQAFERVHREFEAIATRFEEDASEREQDQQTDATLSTAVSASPFSQDAVMSSVATAGT